MMMSIPAFSIIVPVYKTKAYLNECVASVLAQSFRNFELILVDDGSPDECPQICDSYAQQDHRIRVIHKSNGGLSSARNAGLDVANGEYVLFLDSDDFWKHTNLLSSIADRIKLTQADVIIFGIEHFDTNEQTFYPAWQKCYGGYDSSSKRNLDELMKHNIFVACACDKAIKRAMIEKRGLRFKLYQLSEDIEWNALLIKEGISNIAYLPDVCYAYRKGVNSSITANISIKNLLDIVDIIDRYAVPAPEDERSNLLNHYLANQYVLCLTLSMYAEGKELKQLLETLKNYWWLTKYSKYPYVKSVARIRALGFSICRYALMLYKILFRKR